jgi:hypothetical protein
MENNNSPQPHGHGGLTGVIMRRPRTVFWATLAVSLFVGAGIGASGGVEQAKLDTETARADRAQTALKKVSAERDTLRTDLSTERDRTAELAERIKTLSAKGEVPAFVGEDLSEAEGAEQVSAYDWQVKTVRQVSERSPGTVLSQRPSEGTTLKAGRSITLTVAKKAPPKPKQWLTIKTLQGASSTKTPEFTIPAGAKARLMYSMPQDSNNAITLYQAPDEYVDLLLNEIGPQSGSTRLYQSGTYFLDVTGAYNIDVQVFKRPS